MLQPQCAAIANLSLSDFTVENNHRDYQSLLGTVVRVVWTSTQLRDSTVGSAY